MSARLWELEHPYYCSETNFFMGGLDSPPFGHERHESWADFRDAMGDSDLDMNLVFRWDWHRRDDEMDRLYVFFMQQRKGRFIVHSMPVTSENEPAVRAWLQTRFDHLLTMWAPFANPESETNHPSPERGEETNDVG